MQLECRTVMHLCLWKFSPYGENFTRYIVLRVGGSEQNARDNRNVAALRQQCWRGSPHRLSGGRTRESHGSPFDHEHASGRAGRDAQIHGLLPGPGCRVRQSQCRSPMTAKKSFSIRPRTRHRASWLCGDVFFQTSDIFHGPGRAGAGLYRFQLALHGMQRPNQHDAHVAKIGAAITERSQPGRFILSETFPDLRLMSTEQRLEPAKKQRLLSA